MKCFKCKSAERHGSLSYCQPCYNIHVKELRDKKKAKMEEPVKGRKETVSEKPIITHALPSKVEPSEPVHAALKNPLYLSYYVQTGTQLHRDLIEAEKVYEVEGRI